MHELGCSVYRVNVHTNRGIFDWRGRARASITRSTTWLHQPARQATHLPQSGRTHTHARMPRKRMHSQLVPTPPHAFTGEGTRASTPTPRHSRRDGCPCGGCGPCGSWSTPVAEHRSQCTDGPHCARCTAHGSGTAPPCAVCVPCPPPQVPAAEHPARRAAQPAPQVPGARMCVLGHPPMRGHICYISSRAYMHMCT